MSSAYDKQITALYGVTMVKDATASCSDDHMHAALDVNIPNSASAILIYDQVVESLTDGG